MPTQAALDIDQGVDQRITVVPDGYEWRDNPAHMCVAKRARGVKSSVLTSFHPTDNLNEQWQVERGKREHDINN
jgi:protocatechuate 3,4-dioxygenase beta subunit